MRARLRALVRGLELSRREALVIGALVALGVVIRVVATIATDNIPLAGDQPEYNSTGILFADGHPFWGTAPFGVAHESLWKAPLYGLWVGVWYTVIGEGPTRVEMVQAVVGALTILGAWLLARRLFGRGVALLAAAAVAAYPLAWQFGATLYPEALAVPLVTLTLLAFLGRPVSPKLAVGVGVLLGVNLLLRPSSIQLLAGIAVAWVIAAGWRRGAVLTAVCVAVAALVVAPWTIRNAVVADAFVPISVQDSAIYGTFNSTSANDPDNPYAWRAVTPETKSILTERPLPDEVELRRRFYDIGFDYIEDHPASVPKAFFWNGLTRTWDVRRPSHAQDETTGDGRSRKLNAIGLGMYYLLLPLAILGVIRWRRRKDVVLPVLAIALAASVVYTIDASTRYRAPLEPLIVVMAAALFAGRLNPVVDRWYARSTPALR